MEQDGAGRPGLSAVASAKKGGPTLPQSLKALTNCRQIIRMPEFVLGFRHDRIGALVIEIPNGLRASVHLGVFGAADQNIGWDGGIAFPVGDVPTHRFVVIFREEGGN